MGQVLEIPEAGWAQASQPSVLEIPSNLPPDGPISPWGIPNQVQKAGGGPCPGGNCSVWFHDSVSGWWFEEGSGSCDGIQQTFAPFNVITFEEWAAGLASGIDLQTNKPFLPSCRFPSWLPQVGECIFDFYTIVCDETVVIVNIQFVQRQTGCPPGTMQSPKGCVTDPPVPSHIPGELKGAFSKPSFNNSRRVGRNDSLQHAAALALPPSYVLLNPTKKSLIPFVFRGCDCGSSTDELEVI